VRVNAAHASARSSIGDRARIEFGGVFVEALVHKRCPFLDLESAVQVLTGSEAEIESQFFLFDEAEPTRVTIPAAQQTLAEIGALPINASPFSPGSPTADATTVATLSNIQPCDFDRAFDALLLRDSSSRNADDVAQRLLADERLRSRPPMVAALGLFAMRHPILAAGSTFVVGLMLALAAIGVLRVVHAAESMRDGSPRGLAPRSEAASPRHPSHMERRVSKATSSHSISSAVWKRSEGRSSIARITIPSSSAGTAGWERREGGSATSS
jgi:hypothetical protein